MSNNVTTKKVRTEYMKKFRDPKWETFSKCYEDSLKYRLTRRLMEQTHRPLFGDGWDSGSDSSGRSSPRLRGTIESSTPKPVTSSSESKGENVENVENVQESGGAKVNGDMHADAPDASAGESSLPVENGYLHVVENGPSKVGVRRSQRRRVARSEPSYPHREPDTESTADSVLRKPTRAKSQPPGSGKERTSNRDDRRSFIRHDWAERNMETRERRRANMRASVSAGEIHRADVGVQTRRDSEKRGKASDRRRARSADLEKSRRSELVAVNDRWMTEYMRCFSARLR